MSRFLHIRNRIYNLSYLVEASLEQGEFREQGGDIIHNWAVVLYFNHPDPTRVEVILPFRNHDEGAALILHILAITGELFDIDDLDEMDQDRSDVEEI